MQVFLELDHEPQGPVGNEVAVVVVGGVAHREHAVGEMGEPLGQQEILEEVLLDACVAGEVLGDPGREEAVAQPARALARRAVHKQVDGVLGEGLDARGKELVESLIRGHEACLGRVRVDVLAQVDVAQLAGAFQHDGFHVPHGVGLEGFDAVASGRQLIRDDVQTTEAHEIDVAIGQDLVESEEKARRLRAR